MNNIPTRLDILTTALSSTNQTLKLLKERESCWANRLWRIVPTTKNKFDLARAWVKTCKRHILTLPTEREINISPSWLSVDRATTFLASVSTRAALLATKRVTSPSISQPLKFKRTAWPKVIISQIPAVTKVDLWTRALTGVGAAMAAGSHLMKGHCALLVKETTLTNTTSILLAPQKNLKELAISQ